MAEEKIIDAVAEPTAEELNEILRVRREKLANLQSDGNDPFAITKYDVTHYTDDIKNNFDELENTTVSIVFAGKTYNVKTDAIGMW